MKTERDATSWSRSSSIGWSRSNECKATSVALAGATRIALITGGRSSMSLDAHSVHLSAKMVTLFLPECFDSYIAASASIINRSTSQPGNSV